MDYQRRKTRVVNIGGVPLGGSFPVRVQTMTNLPTADIKGQVAQILRAVEAGAEYVRVTTPGLKDVGYLAAIAERVSGIGYQVPLIADVHFSPKVAMEAAKVAAKIRINPGNFLKYDPSRHSSLVTRHSSDPSRHSSLVTRHSSDPSRHASRVTRHDSPASRVTRHDSDLYLEELHSIMRPLLDQCKISSTALRIGTNHGSLSERILDRYGDTPEGMVEATLESVRICRAENFHDIVLSLKSSNVKIMVEATRLLVRRMDEEGMDYPLHLGVTEAGEGEDGRLKSAIGIGSLLVDGIGDTIRVSLTEDPEFEIPVAYGILQASRARITRTEYISCPGCGRTTFRLQEAVKKVKEATAHLTGLKIAVMGCIVNGPGEMADADYGYVGAGPGKVHIYKGKEAVLKNIDEGEAVERMLEVIGSAAPR
jgi:(E)-4-hydroxy-3-methylbut-2-enyl-diphosphate synthase